MSLNVNKLCRERGLHFTGDQRYQANAKTITIWGSVRKKNPEENKKKNIYTFTHNFISGFINDAHCASLYGGHLPLEKQDIRSVITLGLINACLISPAE